MHTIKFVIIFLTLTILVSQTEKGIIIKEKIGNEGKRWAICVGINDYEERGILDLKKARNDALALSETLKKYGQFDYIYTFTDDNDAKGENYPSLKKLKARLSYLKDFVSPNDLIVFSFSGHGVTNDKGDSYLVLADTDPNEMFKTSLKLKDVTDIFTSAGVKKSLLIVDACREAFQENKGINTMGLKSEKFEKSEVAATFYATKDGWYSYEDDDSDYGAFTKHVLDGLSGEADKTQYQGNSDGIVTFSELASYVEDGVKEWSLERSKKQIPYTKIWGEKYGDLALSSYTGVSDSYKNESRDILKESLKDKYSSISSNTAFAYINSDKVLAEFSEAKKAKELLAQWNKEQESKAKEMENEITDLENEIKNMSIWASEEEKNSKMQTGQNKLQAYYQFKDQIWGEKGEFYKKNNELMQPIIDKINTSIKELAESTKYKIVFDANTGTMLYSPNNRDITDFLIEVIEKNEKPLFNSNKSDNLGSFMIPPISLAYINSDILIKESSVEEINSSIKKLSSNLSYDLVLDANTGTLLYSKPEFEITNLVVKELRGQSIGAKNAIPKKIKYGYINSDKVLAEYNEAKKAKQQLANWNKDKEDKAKAMESEITTLENEIKNMSVMVSESKRNAKMNKGQELLQEYYKYKDQIWGEKGEFYKKNNELMQPIIDKINKAIRNFAEKNNFDLIVDANTGTLLFSEPEYELTDSFLSNLGR